MNLKALSIGTSMLLLTNGIVSAQEYEALKFGNNGDSSFRGSSIARLSDITGDGIDELIVGHPGFDSEGKANRGRVDILEGSTFAVRSSYIANEAGHRLGIRVIDGGDYDSDGKADVVASAPGANVFLGVPNCTGYNSRPYGDVFILSGDNLGYIKKYSAPNTIIQSTASGPLLGRKHLTRYGSRFGLGLASLGDVTADGEPDLVMHAPWGVAGSNDRGHPDHCSVEGGTRSGALYMGSNSATAQNSIIIARDGLMGGVGDITGDSIPDYVHVLAHSIGGTPQLFIGLYEGAHFLLEAGHHRGLIIDTPTYKSIRNPTHINGIEDLDGDGVRELAIGGYRSNSLFQGRIEIFLSSTGFEWSSPDHQIVGDPRDYFGVDFDNIDDIEGDGKDDILVAAGGNTGTGSKGYNSYAAIYSGSSSSISSGSEPFIKCLTEFEDPVHEVEALGDQDGDTVADFAVSTSGGVYIFLSNTSTGSGIKCSNLIKNNGKTSFYRIKGAQKSVTLNF